MRSILFFIFSLVLIGCSGGTPQAEPDLVSGQEKTNSVLAAMGEILGTASDKSIPNCKTEKQIKTCDLDKSTCEHSDYLLTLSGSNCPTDFYLRNEIRKVVGGARGTFRWTLTSANPAMMPGHIEALTITGQQDYKNSQKDGAFEIAGHVVLEGKIVAINDDAEKTEYTFIIRGKENFSTANKNAVGTSQIELVFLGKTLINKQIKSFRTSLKEVVGFNSNRKKQAILYYLDNKAIGLDKFKLFSDLGLTFFFKSTPATDKRPWLGYSGPFKDFLQLPTGL